MKIACDPFGCMSLLTAIRYSIPVLSVRFACLWRRPVAGASISPMPPKAVGLELSPSADSCQVSEEDGAAMNH